MNWTAALLLAGCLQVSAAGYSQGKITLSAKNTPLNKVFASIKEQIGYSFWYDESVLDNTVNIDINVKDATMQQVLAICCLNQPITYSIVGKLVVIKEKKGKLDNNPPDKIDVQGKVINEKGEPLPGTTISVNHSDILVATDNEGRFTLQQLEPDASLVISHVGYESKEISIQGNKKLIIQLLMSLNKLDEVQVIAYGTVTKRLNTGNVSTVTSETISKQPISNPLAAIEGRMSGVYIQQATGVAGGDFSIQIRGQNSLRTVANGQIDGNAPLYIIDGVPFVSSSLTIFGGANGKSNPLNDINPSDIESINILKDADATAIYGSRGANGVVLITTKKGESGQTGLEINGYCGVGQVTRRLKYLDLRQYLDMRYEAFKNDNALPGTSDYDLTSWDTTRSTDWQKLAIGGTAKYTDLQTSLSGGSSNTNFIIGAGYHRESSVFPGTFSDKKASIHFNLTHASNNKKFKATFSGSYLNNDNYLPPTDLTLTTNLPPDAPAAYDSSGKLNWAAGFNNPFTYLGQTYKASSNNLMGNTVLSYEIFAGLNLKTSMGYTKLQLNEGTEYPLTSLNPAYGYNSGYNISSNNSFNTWIIEPQLTFQRNVSKGSLNLLLGETFQENTNQAQALYLNGYSSDAMLGNIASASTIIVIRSDYSKYRYNAFFGRINYNWQDKYIINLTGRRDGSSRFGPGKQFANFGAIGASWIFSKERFFTKLLPIISFGKLHGSFGITGSDQIGDYQYLSTYSTTQYIYQGNAGLLPTQLFNPDYAWEINKKIEVGLEMGFMKDRLFFSTSVYRNRSSNQLVGKPLPLTTGFSSIQSNFPAVVQNSGVEVSISSVNIKRKFFTWKSNFNLTVPNNKLVSFPDISSSGYNSYYSVGQPLNIFKGLHFVGVDAQTGMYQFLDKSGKITTSPSYPDDYMYTKRMGATLYGGFGNSFQYKGWQLDIFIQFTHQNVFSGLYSALAGTAYNQPSKVLERWQKIGDITRVQRYNQDYSLYNNWSNANYSSDQQIENGSFLRLKNISFSYEIQGIAKQKMHLRNLRIYIQAQNLITLTHFNGLDPEAPGVLPLLRVITAGLQIGL